MNNNTLHLDWLKEEIEDYKFNYLAQKDKKLSNWTYDFLSFNWKDSYNLIPNWKLFINLLKRITKIDFELTDNELETGNYYPINNNGGIYKRKLETSLSINLIHEPCHWIVATEEQRRLINYGLGLNFIKYKEEDKPENWQIIKEAEASLLTCLFLRWFRYSIIGLTYPSYMIAHIVSTIYDKEFFNLSYNDKNSKSIIEQGYSIRNYIENDKNIGWEYFTIAKNNLIDRKMICERKEMFYNKNRIFLSLNPEYFELDYSHKLL